MRINIILICLLFLTGCFRGSKFESSPIHLNPNMDNQQKYRSLEESNFFADGSTMRKPIEGTIARGMIAENHSFISGKNDDGSYLISNPVELSLDVLSISVASFTRSSSMSFIFKNSSTFNIVLYHSSFP